MKDRLKFFIIIVLVIVLFLLDVFIPFGASNDIITLLRLPRSISIILVGFLLSTAGLVIQHLTRNPLADPFIIGTSSGAMLGIIISSFLSVSSYSLTYFFIVNIFAFFSTSLSLRISSYTRFSDIVLSGVSVNSFILSLIVLFVIFSEKHSLDFLHISLGSFSYSDWKSIIYSASTGGLAVFLIFFFIKDLKIISFHEEKSKTLGIDKHKTTIFLYLLSSLLSSSAVSLSGIIGFIGLMSPHITRIYFNNSKLEFIFFANMLIGSMLLFVASLISRIFFYPLEIPPGVFTSIAGSIFFVYLLVRRSVYNAY